MSLCRRTTLSGHRCRQPSRTGDCGRHPAPTAGPTALRFNEATVDPIGPADTAADGDVRRRRAVEAMPAVLGRLSARSTGRLAGTNVVVTADSPYGPLVVKTMVWANGAEAQTLRAWMAAGVAVPDVVSAGRSDNGAAFIATRRVVGTVPDVASRFEDIAWTLRRMHDTPAQPGLPRPTGSGDVMAGWAVDTLAGAGHRLGRAAAGLADLMGRPGGVLVHGDLKAANLLQRPDDGAIVVLDPHGFVGQRERDLARLLLDVDPDCDRDLSLFTRRLRACYGPHDFDALKGWIGGHLLVRAALAVESGRGPVRPLIARAERLLVSGPARLAA